MAGIVVCGGGVCGLLTAMALAKDGHEVTVVERDPAAPCDPADAWDDWERRGVNQFRLPHFVLPRFKALAQAEFPAVVEGLEAAGAYAFNFFGPMRDVVPDVERFDVLTARRPVLESVVARVAEATPGITIRRGTAVQRLTTDSTNNHDIPHVVGIETEDGETINADLVVVATGRRSPLPKWLQDAGSRPPTTEVEDSGFVYYGRHVVSANGTPVVQGPTLVAHGSVSLIALPGDNGTAGIGLVGWSEDAPLRRLRHEAPWQAVMRSLPLGPQLLDAEPISPLVAMAGLEDRWNRFVVDGDPVATGVVAVADAWAATNPTLGRGITLGALHGLALRDTVRDVGLDDPHRLATTFDERTQHEFTPWYRSTIWHDRNRLADCETAVEGVDPRPEPDPRWADFQRLQRLAATDLALATRVVSSNAVLTEQPETLLADPEIQAKLQGQNDEPAPPPTGPDRAGLLRLLAAIDA